MPFWLDCNQVFDWTSRRARGVFAGPIAPGEQLDPRAAIPVAAALQGADIVLCDEDRLDAEGQRHGPCLGEGWDPDRVLAAGRTGLPLVRTSLLRRARGLRSHGTMAELLLRAAALAGPGRIAHVPALWLSRPEAAAPSQPPSPAQAMRHLAAHGQPGCSLVPHEGTLRVIHPLPRTPPRASVIIATRNRAELLGPCVEGLLARTDYAATEVLIVDNGSDEAAALSLLTRLAQDRRVRVLPQPGPFNWAALNNAGVAAMSGEIAVLLNNDTVVLHPDWLREMVSQAIRPGIGAVGAKLLYPDRTVQHAGVVLDRRGHALHMWRGMPETARGYLDSLIVTREVTAVTGACLAIPRAVYQAVGGCDAEHLPVTWNDVDLCLRVRAHGLRVIWTPHASLLHLEQASRGSDDTPENDRRFRREQAWMRSRWGDTLVTDPFLNTNMLPSETVVRLAVRL